MEITKEQMLQIVALNAQGKSIKEIAKIAKVSEAKVITILANYAEPKNSTTNLIKPRLTAEEINEMYRLADEGLSVRKIASKVGRGVSTVKRQLIKRSQLADPKPEPAPEPEPAPAPEPEVPEAPEETKTKEPAPEATGTSSKKDNVYVNDSIYKSACQVAFEYADQATKDILQIYGNMTSAEKRAFDFGVVYLSTLYARNNLENAIMGDDDENV